jgi:hypothetical protein
MRVHQPHDGGADGDRVGRLVQPCGLQREYQVVRLAAGLHDHGGDLRRPVFQARLVCCRAGEQRHAPL